MDNIRFGRNRYLVVGRAGMDLYADPPGTQIEYATHFTAALGGSAANIAAAISRLGGQASLLSCVSDDAVGRFVSKQLAEFGIEANHVFKQNGEVRTSLAVVETRSDNCQAVIYRNNAADFQLSSTHVGAVDLEPFGALVLTGTCLALEPSRSAIIDLMHRANLKRLPIVFDIDYRAYSWASRKEAASLCRQAADLADIIVGNNEEFDLLAGATNGGIDLAKSLSSDAIVIHKMGERGSISFTGSLTFETPVFPVKAIKPTGAGDAFLGALCTNLAIGHTLQDAVRRGAAAAAIVVSRVGCAPASPTSDELDAFLSNQSVN